MATKIDLDTVIEAIKGEGRWANSDSGRPISSGGNIRLIANRLGVSRQTIYSYKKKWKTVEDALKDEKEEMLDLAENKLWKLINDENITAIIFYLKTQGKQRGYVERQEYTGADDEPMEIVVKYATNDSNNS